MDSASLVGVIAASLELQLTAAEAEHVYVFCAKIVGC